MRAPRIRNSIGNICLWIAILAIAISVGGNVFQMMVVDPFWSAAPPESIQAYFADIRHFEALGHFHQNPFFLFGLLCLLASVVLYWNNRAVRRWLLTALIVEALIIVGTIMYVYPINDVLLAHRASGISSATAVTLTHRWLFADRFRFALKVLVFLLLLRALQVSVAEQKCLTSR
jgi:hypothetical protein